MAILLQRIGLIALACGLLGACSIDLGSRDSAPAPEFAADEMHERHHGSSADTWCCAECSSRGGDGAVCSDCRRDRPSSCAAGETTLVCRDNYTEEGARRERTVTCF